MKIAVVLFLILLVVCGFIYYQHHDAGAAFGNGDITARDGSSVDKSSDNPAIADSHAATQDNSPSQGVGSGQSTNQPFNQTNSQTAQSTLATPASATVTTATGLPAADSESANAPDQLRFGGAGRYQWYRQGDLTWRIDTVSGAMCVAFATMPEWRKADVINHGCGNA